MKTTVVDLITASTLLCEGKVVAIPTETVYGLAANIAIPHAVANIFELKGRPTYHPLIIHLAEKESLYDYAIDVPDYVQTLLTAFCPGPLTFVLKRSDRVPLTVTGNQDTVGIRFPAHPLARALIQAVGHPLAAPSANKFGRISPTSPEHVFAEFGYEVPILDGGSCLIGIESTIIDATCPDSCAILREGNISRHALQAVLGSETELLTIPKRAVRVSGALKKHYAPSKPTILFSSADELASLRQQFRTLEVLCQSPQYLPPSLHHTLMPTTAKEHAQVLYHRLRSADSSASEAIAVETPPHTPEWAAVHDRLSRACSLYSSI